MKNTFLSEMNSRGFLNQCTDLEGLKKILNQKTIKAYIGFDTTAPSLHVGSLMQIMILRLASKIWTSTNCFVGWRNNINRRSIRERCD